MWCFLCDFSLLASCALLCLCGFSALLLPPRFATGFGDITIIFVDGLETSKDESEDDVVVDVDDVSVDVSVEDDVYARGRAGDGGTHFSLYYYHRRRCCRSSVRNLFFCRGFVIFSHSYSVCYSANCTRAGASFWLTRGQPLRRPPAAPQRPVSVVYVKFLSVDYWF